MKASNLIYLLMYFFTLGIILSLFLVKPIHNGHFKLMDLLITLFAMTLVTKYLKGFLFMMVAPWYDAWKFADNNAWEKQNPTVSVLVPAYNEEVGLLSTVRSIMACDYSPIEIVVVNDGSKDDSDKIMREFLATEKMREGVSIKYFYKENGGKGKALNYGLNWSSGSIIMSIDADCILDPKAITNFVKRFDNPTVMAVVGNVKVGNTQNPVSMLQKLEFQFSFYWKKAESLLGIIYIIGGAAGAFRREVFDHFGGYDTTSITEDIDLSVKLQDQGMRAVYADDAVVYTEGAVTLKGLVKQRIRWKYGWLVTFAKHSQLICSVKAQHSKLLGWFIIPFTYLNNALLFVEPWMIILLYIYCYLTHDFSPFITWIILESIPFFIHALFDDSRSRKINFLALSPISWLIFHISTYVEYRALIGSLRDIVLKREATWGVWTRSGVGIVLTPADRQTVSAQPQHNS